MVPQLERVISLWPPVAIYTFAPVVAAVNFISEQQRRQQPARQQIDRGTEETHQQTIARFSGFIGETEYIRAK